MSKSEFKTIHRSDYLPPEFLVDSIDLTFHLHELKTRVIARSKYKRNPETEKSPDSIKLFGEQLELNQVLIDGTEVNKNRLTISDRELIISHVPDTFELEIDTTINPQANSSLSGLYLSSSIFCTQCEAEGFRRITYYPDRPDVLAKYSTRIEAESEKYPVLLSNGNLVDEGILENGYHYAQWQDPYPKPSYLFALVAGNLIFEPDTFTTRSGKVVDLYIYTEPRNEGTCRHAITSLKKSMKWDEDVYGLEYDLDRYMIVAVDDFNMGAMENKGLNIFNSKYVLATQETATDQDYLNIEGVIAHEYFHNWTGNRVTCRDWFQLSLKEGLTVFRDQEFSSDMNSRPVQRIKDVRILRQYQFREDGGPMAHPVRPDTYMEINNFYTVTVYNKGAEVVRMLHTLIGPESFRKGMDLYFQRHDRDAVTCDDFVAAMADASGRDLEQYKLWYSQAGTPEIEISESWSDQSGEYAINLKQNTPETPGQSVKLPFHLPVLAGLLDPDGKDMVKTMDTDYPKRNDSLLLELTETEQRFVFGPLPHKPVLSVMRTFSAPVKREGFQDKSATTFLMAHDSDLFNRWDASFSLSKSIIIDLADSIRSGADLQLDSTHVKAVKSLLVTESSDDSLTALALQLPEESYLGLSLETIDPDQLHEAHSGVKQELATQLFADFLRCYQNKTDDAPYSLSPQAIGSRSLKNVCLDYLVSRPEIDQDIISIAEKQYYLASNMTDQIAVLSSISNLMIDARDELFNHFEQKWLSYPLVMDKWFTMQALSQAEDTFEKVEKLMRHPSFSIKNPNKVRALIGAFSQNQFHFHHLSGRGYEFLVDKILQLDRINPQIAARLTNPLILWRRFEPQRREMMNNSLQTIKETKQISRDVFEIADGGLA